MALITISGYPCSGKSTRAEQLRQHLEECLQTPSYAGPQLKVVVLSDDTLNLSRDVYNDGRAEKPARAALFTAAQRQMGPDTLLIVDSMNYIKGFRYQLYCAAREHKLRVCTVFVAAPPDRCKAWNDARLAAGEPAYAPETLDNLLVRYEEPSSMVRWDAPLFTVPWDEPARPLEDVWRAVTEGRVKPPNAGTQAVPKAPTDALRSLESTTAALVAALMAEQAASGPRGGVVSLSLSPSSLSSPSPSPSPAQNQTQNSTTLTQTLELPARHIALSELQRLKRQFVAAHRKAITLGTVEKGAVDWGEAAVADKFARFLEAHLGG